MAFIIEFTCVTCGEPRRELVHPTRECIACRAMEASRARRAHLAGLQASLTLSERLARIEATLYDLDAEQRLKALESHHIKY